MQQTQLHHMQQTAAQQPLTALSCHSPCIGLLLHTATCCTTPTTNIKIFCKQAARGFAAALQPSLQQQTTAAFCMRMTPCIMHYYCTFTSPPTHNKLRSTESTTAQTACTRLQSAAQAARRLPASSSNVTAAGTAPHSQCTSCRFHPTQRLQTAAQTARHLPALLLLPVRPHVRCTQCRRHPTQRRSLAVRASA